MIIQVGENQSLAVRENIKNELLEIKTIEDGIGFLNKLKTVEVWVKAEKRDAELQNLIAEQKLRTGRILGDLISEGQKSGEIRRQNEGAKVTTAREVTSFGLSHKQSSTFQQIASIPDEDFEEFIEEKKEKVNHAVAELTTAGAVRLAKSIKEKRENIKVVSGLSERIRIEKELKELADSVNKKYSKEERKLFITFIKI